MWTNNTRYDSRSETKNTYLQRSYYCQLCLSYPSHIVLPSEFDDADWRKATEFRDASRAPAVSWIGSHGRAILRCAQPLPGRLGLGRSPQDERLLTLASQGAALAIVDARSRQNAWANQVKGAGFERQENYGVSIVQGWESLLCWHVSSGMSSGVHRHWKHSRDARQSREVATLVSHCEQTQRELVEQTRSH